MKLDFSTELELFGLGAFSVAVSYFYFDVCFDVS